jgi:23S rRNA (uracil1939-C5)-methyltransferase
MNRPTMSSESIDLTLTGLAYGGDAYGRDASGRMVFVPFALPGERVRVDITEPHQQWGRGRIVHVLQPSPERIVPRCPHFTECGGCHYQHMPYSAQLQAKAEIVGAQLQRLGGFANPPVQPSIPSPSPWNTRNHLQFSVTPDGHLGFQAAGSHRVVPIRECHLPEPALAELWPQIDMEAIPGLARVALRSGAPGESMIILEGEGEPGLELTVDLPTSIVWLSPEGLTVLAGGEHFIAEVLGRPFRVSAESFFQVHTQLAGSLVRRVVDGLSLQPRQIVYDLYAGVGLFSAFLAQTGSRLVAVEQSPSACRDFEANLEQYETVDLYEASVEETLPALKPEPDAVVVDPPRSGLGAQAIEALVALAPPQLAYLSCDPATLARDARRLAEAGYALQSVLPFDLFPQTYHIETLSLWTR